MPQQCCLCLLQQINMTPPLESSLQRAQEKPMACLLLEATAGEGRSAATMPPASLAKAEQYGLIPLKSKSKAEIISVYH